MPDLILVRHSISRQQPEVSSHTWELTAEGRARCTPLAERLRSYQPAVIVTSGEPKTIQTGEAIGQLLGLPVETERGLGEHKRDHAPYFDSPDEFRATIHQLLAQPDKLIYGEDTGDEARTRFQTAVNRLLANHKGKTVIAVTHGTVMALFLAHVAAVEPVEFWQTLGMPAYVVLRLPDYEVVEIVNEI